MRKNTSNDPRRDVAACGLQYRSVDAFHAAVGVVSEETA
jgi:hypothetical protein